MDLLKISGRVYPGRPPGHRSVRDRERRLSDLCRSLDHAAGLCGEVERRLYKAIRQVQAQAENLRDAQRAERLPDPEFWKDPISGNGL